MTFYFSIDKFLALFFIFNICVKIFLEPEYYSCDANNCSYDNTYAF